ncbi:hypothetical protein ACFSRY_19755 [Pontibacter locisalis]|uniref:Uncharacterized protein n=1 Tax=Pontibacter locisalis TaxID=1719035 RepID=A0ABW5IR32_9BACT
MQKMHTEHITQPADGATAQPAEMTEEGAESTTEPFGLGLDAQDLQQLPRLYQKLREPLFSLRQAGIASKLYVDWKKAGLAPATEEQGWTRLSFLEYLWLRMARELRELGLPLARAKALREYLFHEFRLTPEVFTPQLLERVEAELRKTAMPLAQVAEVLALAKSGQLDELLGQFGVSFTLLEAMVYGALYRKQEAGLLLFASGEQVPWLDEMLGMGPEGQRLLERTHVFLSVTEHLAEFILDEEKADYIPRLSLLSEEELQVVRAVRNKSFRQVTVTFGEKRQITLRTTSDGMLDEALSKELIETLALKNYQSVELENRGGSKLRFTKEHRRRI